MRAKILLICFVFCSIFSFGQDCPWEKCSIFHSKYHWIKVAVTTRRTIFIDMGGASAHSEWQIENHTFKKWLPWETKGPKVRHLYNVRVQTIKIQTFSNDDTGPDHLSICGNGTSIFESDFGIARKFTLNYDFVEAKALTFTVSNSGALNNSPGAFEIRIWIKCEYVHWRWKRILIK